MHSGYKHVCLQGTFSRQPGVWGIMPFELLECFKCEISVQDVLTFHWQYLKILKVELSGICEREQYLCQKVNMKEEFI